MRRKLPLSATQPSLAVLYYKIKHTSYNFWIVHGDTIINNLEEDDEYYTLCYYHFLSGNVIRIIDKNEVNAIMMKQQQDEGDKVPELQILSDAISRIARNSDGVLSGIISRQKLN